MTNWNLQFTYNQSFKFILPHKAKPNLQQLYQLQRKQEKQEEMFSKNKANCASDKQK